MLRGFESFDADTILAKWGNGLALPSGVSYVSNGGLTGGGCARLGAGVTGSTPFQWGTAGNPVAGTTYSVFFRFRFNGTTFTDATASYLLALDYSGGWFTLARINASGQVLLYDTGPLGATSQPVLIGTVTPPSGINLLDGNYHQFEFQRSIPSGGTGANYHLWLDGQSAYTNTFNSAGDGRYSAEAWGSNGATGSTTIDIDDVVIWNTNSSVVQDFSRSSPISSSTARLHFVTVKPNLDVTDATGSFTLVGGATKHAILSTPLTGIGQATYLYANKVASTTTLSAGIGWSPVQTGQNPTVYFLGESMYYEFLSDGGETPIFNTVDTILTFNTGNQQVLTQGLGPNTLLTLLSSMAADPFNSTWTPTTVNASSSQFQATNSNTSTYVLYGKIFAGAREVLVLDTPYPSYVVTNICC